MCYIDPENHHDYPLPSGRLAIRAPGNMINLSHNLTDLQHHHYLSSAAIQSRLVMKGKDIKNGQTSDEVGSDSSLTGTRAETTFSRQHVLDSLMHDNKK